MDVAAEAAQGNLLAIDAGNDGEHDDQQATFELFVDEPVDPALERHAGKKRQCELRALSGRLVVGDMFEGEVVEAGEHSIPPGNYRVTWFHTDWGDELDEAGDDAAKAATAHGVTAERILGPLTGVLIVITLIALGWGGCNAITSDESTIEVWRTVRSYVMGFALAWVIVLLLWRVTGAGKASRVREQRQGEFTDLVVHLERRTE